MSAVPQGRITYPQYLDKERQAESKSEYYRGELFAMTGESPNHNTIAGNVFAQCRSRLRGSSCRPFNSDQRIRIDHVDLSTYPDVSIIYGDLQVSQQDQDAIINPRVLVEVLSKSTERYDRGKKFMFYRQIDSLEEFILISQSEALVERYTRQAPDDWLLTVSQGLEAKLYLTSVDIELSLTEIFEDVAFEQED